MPNPMSMLKLKLYTKSGSIGKDLFIRVPDSNDDRLLISATFNFTESC